MKNSGKASGRVLVTLGATLLATAGALVVSSGVVSAHYATVTAKISCVGFVQWTAASYAQEAAGNNDHVDVVYELGVTDGSDTEVLVGTGAFMPGPDGLPGSFSNSFAWPASNPAAITMQAHERSVWSNGAAIEEWDPITVVYRPESCPSNPDVAVTVTCADGAGSVSMVLANNSGPVGDPITFVVTHPVTEVATPHVVPSMQSESLVFDGVPTSVSAIEYTVDGEPASVAIDTSCDGAGRPSVSGDIECVDGNGTIVVMLANTGGDLPVAFVVTDPSGGTVARTVAPGASTTVTFTGVSDSVTSIGFTADGEEGSLSLEVGCDRPGTPVVGSSIVCSAGSNQVTVTLSNTAGEQSVVFSVTNPVLLTTEQVTVGAGLSVERVITGLGSGSVTIPIMVGTTNLSQTLELVCVVPSTSTATTTTTAATTTTVASGGPTPTTTMATTTTTATSTSVASGGPTPTPAGVLQATTTTVSSPLLPSTGSSSTALGAAMACALMGFGLLATRVARRGSESTPA